jgi:hypothetical protein
MPDMFPVEQDVRKEIDPTKIPVKRALAKDFLVGLKLIG